MGGYLSVPVILSWRIAWEFERFCMSKNVIPGLSQSLSSADGRIRSRSVFRRVKIIFLKGKNVWVSGLPIRPEYRLQSQPAARQKFGLDKDVMPVFCFRRKSWGPAFKYAWSSKRGRS